MAVQEIQTETQRHVARLRYLHIAPRKVRLIASTLRGLPVQEAEAQLLHRPQRAARPLLKLLRSAVANASRGSTGTPHHLFISGIWVDIGPRLKRFLPRAQGRATPIHKTMSHVTLELTPLAQTRAERFVIAPPPKKEKRNKDKKPAKGKAKKEKAPHEAPKRPATEAVTSTKPGFLRRIFRRKSI